MSDTRTPAEIAYDNQRSGAAYVKPSVNDDTLVQIIQEIIRVQEQPVDDELAIATELDRLIAEERAAAEQDPEPNAHFINQRMHNERSPLLNDLIEWTQRGLDAEDADPAPNLPQDMKDWIDRHLAVDRHLAAEALQAGPPEDIDAIIALLEKFEAYYEVGDGSANEPFDHAVDAAAELPRPLRDRVATMIEGFLAGVRAAAD